MSIVSGLSWLESVDAKLDRARQHLDVISRELDGFIKSTRHNVKPKTNLQTNEAWIVWWVDSATSHPPLTISVEIGEFLYNLRSALDNLVCALVRMSGNSYGAPCSRNGFPIHTDCDAFDREARTALKNVPASARTLIQGLQPYSRGGRAAAVDPLNILNVLRNHDTHRALHLGLAYYRNTQVIVSDSFTDRVIAHLVLPHPVYPALEPQTIPLPVTAAEMPTAVNVRTGTAGGVCFRESGPWDDRPVTGVLVTACFKPFFDQFFNASPSSRHLCISVTPWLCG